MVVNAPVSGFWLARKSASTNPMSITAAGYVSFLDNAQDNANRSWARLRKQVQVNFLPRVGEKPDWAPWSAEDSLFGK